jgi:hypothetical protein
MHGPAARWETGSASRGAWTRRVTAGTAWTLEDRTSALNDAGAARTCRPTGTLRRNRTRRRGAVDRSRASLGHDHTLDRRCGRSGSLRGLRRGGNGRRRCRRSNSCRRGRRCRDAGGGGRRSCDDGRTRYHRMDRGGRGNCRALRGGGSSRRSGRNRRTGHDWPSGRLRSNRRGRRRRRSHDLGSLARLRHNNAARRRSFGLRRSSRCVCDRRCGHRRRGWRCGFGRRWRRRSLRTGRRTICLFLALLNGFEDIAGLGDP